MENDLFDTYSFKERQEGQRERRKDKEKGKRELKLTRGNSDT